MLLDKQDRILKVLEILSSKEVIKTELNFENPFTLLVAVVLSAQATDKGVNRATDNLFKIVKSPEEMVNLGEDKLLSIINSINLYRGKARNLIALSKILIEKHKSQVPNTREDLEALPGVGRKTANVVLNVAFGLPTVAVDTHVLRVSNRLGISEHKDPTKVEHDLMKYIPESYLGVAHSLLIMHGRYVCKAIKPLCGECVIKEYCEYYKKR